MSYRLRELTRGSFLRSKERGWPIPPPAPRTATLVRWGADAEKKRDEGVAKARTAARANMGGFGRDGSGQVVAQL